MSLDLAIEVIDEAIGPIEKWANQCHAASLALVKSGLLGEARVARGACIGIPGQHSWAVVGNDCYDPSALIVDITAWSYDESKPLMWISSIEKGFHKPHGWRDDRMSLFEWGCPEGGDGPDIELTPKEELSDDARWWVEEMFRSQVGSLDRMFWSNLANRAPLEGWPAEEIFKAMHETKDLMVLVPIDKIGMLTDINPEGLYF